MLKKFVKLVGSDSNQREIEKLSYVVEQVNSLEPQYESLSDGALAAKTDEFRSRIAQGETLDDILIEAFATVREASKRTIGLRHYDVQLIGGAILHQKTIVEMRTGEGKTLVATMPLYLNALLGEGAHLITVNDYLARRDARWMAPIYNILGLSVGVLQMAARTENGKKAFLVDLERTSPHEDLHQLLMVPRKEAYLADITYGTNSEYGFDYLRDNMTMRWENRVQRGHHYAIIDEVDNVLIDEARTPLIISGPAQDEAEWYTRMSQIVKSLSPEDYEVSDKDRTVTLTELGETHVEQLLGMALGDPDRPEDITPHQARTLGYLEQALRAQHLYRRNKEYLVQAGKVVIVDDFTGRLMPGRRWSDGLHQAVEAKEGVRVQSESVTYATVTIQNYFRMYEKLAGMTGTALTEAEEFDKIYVLQVLALPTNLEYLASSEGTELERSEARDESGYKYTYYSKTDDPAKEPIFWKRKDYPDVVYRTEEAKLRAIALEILRYHDLGRPLLVGTTSVELSDLLSRRLKAEPLRRLAQVMIIRAAFLERTNRIDDGRQIDELQYLNTPLDKLQISQMRQMARESGISFNPEEESNLNTLIGLLDLPQDKRDRLRSNLQAGIPHQVLNARKHTEESQIIAGAGAYGAVTIATNMAGRGVDIKLGGELAEEILYSVNRILRREGYEEPYDMTLEERHQALLDMDPKGYGIYESEVQYFLKHIHEMESVRELGGLHVIGSERHDARRIDNQLRGRAARQGDPGSSRFYLSMEDELMRLFGGGQADALMQRMKIDDSMPLEAGLVSRIVEQAQTRVEGSNFDVRKHLLEYDDVLNTQRTKIYEQRDRIFLKDDLSEDIAEMLETEVARRVPESLADETERWKLLAWLNQIQPSITNLGSIYPSYTLRLILDDIKTNQQLPLNQADTIQTLTTIAKSAIDAEKEHIIQSVLTILEQAQLQLDEQITERMDALDIFTEGLYLDDGEDERSPSEIFTDLISLVQVPIKLTTHQQRELLDEPDQVIEDIRSQIENLLIIQAVARLIGSVERRLEEPIELDPQNLATDNWDTLTNQILQAIDDTFNRRIKRYLGESPVEGTSSGGQITKDLEKALSKYDGPIYEDQLLQLMIMMPQGSRASFDKKTHRRVVRRTVRFNYIYYAALFLDNLAPEENSSDVLEHLNGAQATMRLAWGLSEWNQVASSSMAELNESSQRSLRSTLGERDYEKYAHQPLTSLPASVQDKIIKDFGNNSLTEIYRQLLLSVITELWVDYLTQMEGLRVSIGLEAYAQRDPLVQYKKRAFELFGELLSDVRASVINRIFTYRPRDVGPIVAASEKLEIQQEKMDGSDSRDQERGELAKATDAIDGSEKIAAVEPALDGLSTAQKRRRRRRKKK
jgi:preprotein translocase subunit SecA